MSGEDESSADDDEVVFEPIGATGASPDGLPPLRDVIRAHGLSAEKKLGQNFLLDLNLTRRIARAAAGRHAAVGSLPLAGKTVVEIGPGPGGLTRALFLEGAERVIVIERDERCLPVLQDIGARYPGQLEVHIGDATEINWRALTAQATSKPIVAANLPYNIATLLLIGWLESDPWPPWYERMTLMFQKEVADRITAEPNSKAYGRLSVISKWRTVPKQVLTLKPEAFTPPPKVASAVVEFVPRETPEPACDVKVLGRVTAAAFGQRRKMLRQSLKALTPFPELLLARAGIDGMRRGETLSIAEFGTLAQLMSE
ncbi:MAG: 16S rRNA (adenine(1518)-N(6)/adenine(1519)-N(6))-dimethyltransferase RsmA [Hyphomicrobiaceae bacterium]|nr:16S rRNA (adenine(1518)-N(6)/adenine(1519)-N(6))-dimethyltransferase RsmA [Hyphomicrobiaceae bacterium]